MDLEERISISQQHRNHPERNRLLVDYTPFIVKTISQITGKYITVENSPEYSIGLEAFNESIDRYQADKGAFLSFASLVIKSRLNDWSRKDRYYSLHQPLPDTFDVAEDKRNLDEQVAIQDEISRYIDALKDFEITLDALLDNAPRHEAVRQENIRLSRNIAQDPPITKKLYTTKKLPMTEIALRFQTTKRKLQLFRIYIIALIILFKQRFEHILSFIHMAGDPHV